MDPIRKIQLCVVAAGVCASVAFYCLQYGVPGRGDAIVFDVNTEASAVSADAAPEEAPEETLSEAMREEVLEIAREEAEAVIRESVAKYVRDELIASGEEDYLREAEERALELARERALENEGKVDINHAAREELMSLNGIGEKKAQDIIDYREEIGGYSSIEEIMNVSGIGEGLFSKIKDMIYVREF